MDPALRELIAEGAPGEQVAVVVRLNAKAQPPAGLRVVARFGTIVTARAARHDLARLHADPAIASLKAPRLYAGETEAEAAAGTDYETDESAADPRPTDRRRPTDLAETGKGCVIAVIDWGCDFAHPDFRNAAGGTRLIALWDQSAQGKDGPYGYGRIHSRGDIDKALAGPDPFEALGYRPTSGPASHGTHVLGIAAGNGTAGGPAGVAPEADIVFCHLGAGGGDLGSSVELLEAVHFAAKSAGSRPLAFNFSLGRHAGDHSGQSLIERAIDWLLVNRPGTAVVQSAGNYYSRNVHMSGRLRERTGDRLPFRLARRDPQPVSVEIWYPGADEFHARMSGPGGVHAEAGLGGDMAVKAADGTKIGHFYHRARDPNNGDNLINLFLYEAAPAGQWEMEIEGVDVVDGRWHAWIERNAACPECQGQFLPERADPNSTTGSICNALRTVAVGAYDAHDPAHPLANFSSVGPTRDGRRKPLLAAPGVRILSVRSRPDPAMPPGYVRMSGTSMASPHVAGTLALMMQAAGRQKVATLRQLLFSSLKPAPSEDARWGYGVLDIGAAVAAARALSGGRAPHEGENLAECEAPDAAPAPSSVPEPGDLIVRFLGRQQGEADAGEILRHAVDPDDPGAAVVAWPGRRLNGPLDKGDLIVRETSTGPIVAVVEDPRLMRRDAVARAGLVAEGPWPGLYVRVAEGDGDAPLFARRIAGPDGFVLPDVTILRRVPPGESPPLPPAAGRPTIRRGSSGPAVADAQARLNRIHARLIAETGSGLDKCPLDIDGKYGALTQSAARAFQRRAFPAAPQECDGVIGPKTWAMLDALDAAPPQPVPPGPVPIIPVKATTTIPVIVIPGVMGSRLRLRGAPNWDPDSKMAMFNWVVRLKGPQKLAALDFRSPATLLRDHADPDRARRGWGELAQGFYLSLLEALEQGLAAPHPCAEQPGFVSARYPIWAFGYDWRLSNKTHAARLDAFIHRVLQEEEAQQVILVTHSMGGLVARAALPRIADKVMGVVHTVQPAVGAVAAARRVHTGFHPTIDKQLGEALAEMAEAVGAPLERLPDLSLSAGEPIEAGVLITRAMTAIFSDSLTKPNPIYYGQLMARLPSAVELLPSDAAGRPGAKPDWLRPTLPPIPIHDHYAFAPPSAGGMILAGLPAADAGEFRLRLKEAQAFHAGLTYHRRTGVLFNTGLRTDNAFNPSAASPEVIEREGDGTVPSFSGRCPDLLTPVFRTGFARLEHSDCLKDPTFLATIVAGVDHFAQGRGHIAEGDRPDRARCQFLVA
jgi:subtilisin family serine protease